MGFAASRPLLFSTDSPVVGPVQPGESHRCHFAVFRADSVSVTSTKFAGGDWRWRLSDQEGAILVQAGSGGRPTTRAIALTNAAKGKTGSSPAGSVTRPPPPPLKRNKFRKN